MKKIIAFGVLISFLSCTTGEKTTEIKFNNVSKRGYSQSVEINNFSYKTLYISGQVPIDSKGEIVGVDNLELQTEQVFKNIQSQVEQVGGTMTNLINIDCYFTDISKISEFRKSRDKYINLENPPASTAVQVERLINKDFLIEINATAIIKLREK